jgi:ceramide glucosyltransferase
MRGEILLSMFGLSLTLAATWLYLRLRRAVRHRPGPGETSSYPSVSVIRPIKGMDTGAEENIRAALDHGYPGEVESLFVFDDDSEPALPLVEAAIREHRASGGAGTARVVFSGEPPAGRTGKLNAMIAGLREAGGELIAFVDSDTRADRRALRRLVDTMLGTPGAGSAFAPVVVSHPNRTAGDVAHALLLNAMYGPDAAWVAGRNEGELPFIMGQFMVFTREAISAIGGLESASGQLVDDMYLGMRVKAAGYRNVVSPHPVPIIQQGMSLKAFWSLFIKWIAFSRSGLPSLEFKVSAWSRGLIYFLGLGASIVAAALGWWGAALVNFLAPVAVAASNNALHHDIGGAPLRLRDRWVAFALLLAAPVVYLNIFTRREVSWRGRSYKLDRSSRLAAGGAIPADQACLEPCAEGAA